MSDRQPFDTSGMRGWPRADGRKGVRNYVVVAYLVECAHHVARRVADNWPDEQVQLIGFPGCYSSAYADRMMGQLCTHPNVGAVLLVSLGCEEFRRNQLVDKVRQSGRPADLVVIQENGGTRSSIERGRAWVDARRRELSATPTVPMTLADIVIGTECGGSDGFSGITANPSIGEAVDLLVDAGGTAMFEETCELIGCEEHLAGRAVTPELGDALRDSIRKADDYYREMGHGSFGGGNVTGGLSTIEEKSIGAYAKSGTRPISGLIKPASTPPRPGLYLMDPVNDGGMKYGIPNINDNQTVTEMVACGCHFILFSTGRGSVVGQAIAPVVKIATNSAMYRRMSEDMDVNAGEIVDGDATIQTVGREILERVIAGARGEPTRSEALGHQEFVLGYKTFEPLGPACLPV
jgi:altronate dehydratase large subunit